MCVTATVDARASMISHASTDENHETPQGGLIKALPRSHQVPSFNCRSSAISHASRISIAYSPMPVQNLCNLRATSPPPPGSAHSIISAQATMAQDCSRALSLRGQLKTRFANFPTCNFFFYSTHILYWISIVL